jgi:Skp family chaperone for outer membrane proteins
MKEKQVYSLEHIESELIFDRDVTDETATSRVQREMLNRGSAAILEVAKAFEELGRAADRKTAEFREEYERRSLEAELDEMEGLGDDCKP